MEINSISISSPLGSVIAFAGEKNKIPIGWLSCEGQKLTKSEYSELFNVIGTAWGGTGTPDFYLPDLRGMFLRGVSGESNNDPDKLLRTSPLTNQISSNPGNKGNNVGSIQNSEFKKHNHDGGDHTHTILGERGAAGGDRSFITGDRNSATQWEGNPSMYHSGAIIKEEGGLETRPINAYVFFIIRVH